MGLLPWTIILAKDRPEVACALIHTPQFEFRIGSLGHSENHFLLSLYVET